MSGLGVERAGVTIPISTVRRFVDELFEAVGVPPKAADRLSTYLVRADMRGHPSHGIDLVPFYCLGLRDGLVNATATPEVISRRGATAKIDADGGLGYESSRLGMDLACDLAAEHGVGIVAVTNSNHFGMAGHWVQQAVERDKIGFATTNGPPAMALHGGREPALSNNPFAWGIPTEASPALILDAACSEAALGKIRLRARRGEQVPEGWALDKDGVPTVDARAALAGRLLPFGGAKGSGLAIINEVLAGVVPGAQLALDLMSMSLSDHHAHPQMRIGHFFMAIDYTFFLSKEQFLSRVEKTIKHLRSTGDDVRMPGERACMAEQQASTAGLELTGRSVAALRRLAGTLDVAVPPAMQEQQNQNL